MTDNPRCTGLFQDLVCQSVAPGNPTTDARYHHRRTAQRQVNPNDQAQSGFWPATAAGAAAGAAVGTAAAVATAPFQNWNNSYAYYGGGPGWQGDWNSYAAHNGIVCKPGTWFKGDDGRQHLCQ
jgi:hypothetical protein